MPANRFYIFTLIVLLSVFGYLSYSVFKPFISAIVLAVVLGIIFYPVYIFIRKFVKWKSLASFLTIIIIITLILGPFSYLSIILGKELSGIAYYLDNEKLEKLKNILSTPSVEWILENIKLAFNIEVVDLGPLIVDNIADVGKGLVKNLTLGVKNILVVILNFLFMVFALFFLLKDGQEFISEIRDHLPFSEKQKDKLASQIKDLVISTIYGGVLLAIIEGFIGGVVFSLLGFQASALWGIGIGLIAFLPMLGTLWIWLPVDLYLFFNDFIGKGFILLFVGIFLSMVDNIIKPIIISGRTKMPTLLIFFSVIGGIGYFGLMGIIMGPLVVVLFISFFQIFRSIEEIDSEIG